MSKYNGIRAMGITALLTTTIWAIYPDTFRNMGIGNLMIYLGATLIASILITFDGGK